MSLKLLVIGRGEKSACEVENEHLLDFVATATDEVIQAAAQYEFLFLHLNNPEAEKAVADWIELKASEKLVGFSGGTRVPDKFQSWNYPFVPSLTTRQAVLDLNWKAIQRDIPPTASAL